MGIAVAFQKRSFNRVCEALLAFLVVFPEDKAIDEDCDSFFGLGLELFFIQIDDRALYSNAEEPALLERVELFLQRVPGVIVKRKRNMDLCAIRLQLEAVHRRRNRVPLHQLSAHPAICLTDAPEQQPKVIIDFRRGSDCRARIACRGFLLDRDGRTDALDEIDIRLVHSFQELTGIGRQAFDVPALSFRIDGIECQARLAGAAHTRHDNELVPWELDVDILEVMDPRAADNDRRQLSHGLATVRPGDFTTSGNS